MNEYFYEIVLHLTFPRSKMTSITYLFTMILSKQKTSLFFRLSISVTVFGALFKFISWPLIIVGAIGMVFFHTVQVLQKQNRGPLDYSRHLLIISFSCNYIFSILDLSYSPVFTLLTQVTLVVFLVLYLKEMVFPILEKAQNNALQLNFSTENLSYLLADLAIIYIVIASLFKILHWEFGIINGNVLLVIGLCSALISILASPKDFRKQETS